MGKINVKEKRHPPIFLVGCARSGTTLLKDLFNSHPDIKFPVESQFLLHFYYIFGDPKNDKEAITLLKHIKNESQFQKFKIKISENEIKEIRSYSKFIDYIFTKYAKKYGGKRWGDKTPYYVLKLKTIIKLFPDAKIVHIIRDGRDVALSIIPKKFGSNNVYTAAKSWKRHVEQGHKQGIKIGKNQYKEIRYEDLLNNQEEVLKSVCKFLDLKYTKKVHKPDYLFAGNIHGKITNRLSTKKIIKTNQMKWKTKMSKKDCLIFQSVAGDILKKNGYEVNAKAYSYELSAFKKTYFTISDKLIGIYNKITYADFLKNLWKRNPLISLKEFFIKIKRF